MTNTRETIQELNTQINSIKKTITVVSETNKDVFAAYKDAKKKIDTHVATLRDLEKQKKSLENTVRKNIHTTTINNMIKNINQFDWATTIDCSDDKPTPPELKNILRGTIVSAESYNPYTEQRTISVSIRRKTSNVDLLIAKTIIEQVKECPIPENSKGIIPNFIINHSEYRTKAVLINNKWCFQYFNNNISEPFKSLDHLLKSVRKYS